MTPVSHHEADQLTTGYVCAACWGTLASYLADDGCVIKCADCGEDTPGFVSRQFTERRISENLNQYFMAQTALREAVPWMFPHTAGKTSEQLLHELGY